MDVINSSAFSVLADNLPLLLAYTFLLSVFIGSFINVVIYRIPIMLESQWKSDCQELLEIENKEKSNKFNLCFPRSNCPSCGHQVKAIENIPIISYLFLKGKCNNCKAKISIQYPIIELLTALMTCIVVWRFGFSLQSVAAAILTWYLIALSGIDIKTQLLPDNMTLPLLWIGILFSVFACFTDLQSSVIGAIAGYLALWCIFQLFKLVTGKEGMGYGDFKLLAALGAWLGWQQLPVIVLLSSLVGAVIGIAMIVSKLQSRSQPIPFGPYLALAGWIAMLYGNDMTNLYLSNIR